MPTGQPARPGTNHPHSRPQAPPCETPHRVTDGRPPAPRQSAPGSSRTRTAVGRSTTPSSATIKHIPWTTCSVAGACAQAAKKSAKAKCSEWATGKSPSVLLKSSTKCPSNSNRIGWEGSPVKVPKHSSTPTPTGSSGRCAHLRPDLPPTPWTRTCCVDWEDRTALGPLTPQATAHPFQGSGLRHTGASSLGHKEEQRP